LSYIESGFLASTVNESLPGGSDREAGPWGIFTDEGLQVLCRLADRLDGRYQSVVRLASAPASPAAGRPLR